MAKQYGISSIKNVSSELELHLENIRLKGYTILKGVLDNEETADFNKRIEVVYSKQKEEFGEDNLAKINERNVVRMLFNYDKKFS